MPVGSPGAAGEPAPEAAVTTLSARLSTSENRPTHPGHTRGFAYSNSFSALPYDVAFVRDTLGLR